MNRPSDNDPPRVEAVLAKKRARLCVLGEIERRVSDDLLPTRRLLAEIDYALTNEPSETGPVSGRGKPVEPLDEQIDLILPRV